MDFAMDYGQHVLTSTCEKCKKTTCVRCQERTCLNCKRTFTDHHNVGMIADYGICIECGIWMTEKYKQVETPKKEPGTSKEGVA